MQKTDFKKTLSSYKAKNGKFAIVDVPTLRYLMVDGKNGPASADFQAAKVDAESLDKVRLADLVEGKVVQTLHLGSFDSEGPVLKSMHEEFIPDNGLKMCGKHHEIYFSDFRKTAPEKLRTILRQPVY